jgi:hypothetical protein
MSKTPHNSELNYIQGVIDVRKIDPSPYQHRRHFNEHKLKELAASIQREGLIEPIIVRPIDKHYELIAGERRLRAVRDFTEMKTIQAQIVIAGDLQARRISAAENLQREDLSSIETIEAIVEIVDAELIEDIEYLSMGKTPADRVKTLLAKLDSVRSSQERGSEVSNASKPLFHKFVEQVDQIFKNLPKSLEWRSFYNHDLTLLVDICKEVQDISIQHNLNKSQTRALAKLNAVSESEFQRIVNPQPSSQKIEPSSDNQPSVNRALSDFSATEIESIANKEIQKEALAEQERSRVMPHLSSEVKILLLDSLGIPDERIAERLKINRKTVTRFCNNLKLFQSIRDSLDKGLSVSEVAKKHGCPEPLVWSIALEGKSDLDRFKALNWGLRAWDLWNWNDCDKRFGDDWPGRIPAQMIAHILYYFSDQNDLVFDPMAGGGVVADTCLAFNRKCWSFDMDDRTDTRPEIEPYFWDITNLKWPIKGKTKPDLIIFDPPYFKKQSNNYDPNGISGLSKEKYLLFLESFFSLAHLNAKKSTQMAFINADWRDFQNTPAKNETRVNSILINDYLRILNQSGWQETHIFQAPLSSERFKANVVSAMQKKKIIGVTSRYVIISKKK